MLSDHIWLKIFPILSFSLRRSFLSFSFSALPRLRHNCPVSSHGCTLLAILRHPSSPQLSFWQKKKAITVVRTSNSKGLNTICIKSVAQKSWPFTCQEVMHENYCALFHMICSLSSTPTVFSPP